MTEAKALAESVVSSLEFQFDRIRLWFLFLGVPKNLQREILKRWISMGYPPLTQFAPYAAYVMQIEVFFQVALAANLISNQRPSNRIDIGYLFYLPFSMVFISTDRLHEKCAPFFLRNDQEFIWGKDLKEDLAKLNKYYSELPNSTKEKGVKSFASSPPKDGEFLVTRLWDRHIPRWREKLEIPEKAVNDPKFRAYIKKISEQSDLEDNAIANMTKQLDWIITERSIRKIKGSWWQVPKDLEDSKNSQIK